jgi:hypothetical protein
MTSLWPFVTLDAKATSAGNSKDVSVGRGHFEYPVLIPQSFGWSFYLRLSFSNHNASCP